MSPHTSIFVSRHNENEGSSRTVGEEDAGRTASTTDGTLDDNQERKQRPITDWKKEGEKKRRSFAFTVGRNCVWRLSH